MSFGHHVDLFVATVAGLGIGAAQVAASSDNDGLFHSAHGPGENDGLAGGWGRFLGLSAAGTRSRASSGASGWTWGEMLEVRSRLYWIFAVIVLLLIGELDIDIASSSCRQCLSLS